MRILSFIAAVAVFVGCVDSAFEGNVVEGEAGGCGLMSVAVRLDDAVTKSQTDYVTALDDEAKANKVTVLVFDKSTGALNASMEVDGLSDKCEMNLPVGAKLVYAVVNGPSLSSVLKLTHLNALLDDLSRSDMSTAGLTLVGSKECSVVAGSSAVPVTVTVRWLVSRVVLRKVECNLPAQYGSMTIDCVYLGNANSVQTFAGAASTMVNVKGLSSDGKPVGQSGVKGACDSYMYRAVGKTVSVGGTHTEKYHMYCQPNQSDNHTCIYLLTTIGGGKYYYRVPLNQGLVANSTCTVDLKITNLGSPTPPDGDLQKGEITASITVAGWTAGNGYVTEF